MHVTPSKSGRYLKPSMVPSPWRSPSHAVGAWQRMHAWPAESTSWLAIVTDACQIGSRALCAIMLAIHDRNGAVFAS